MSDAAPVRAVLLGHGALPDGMVDAVRQITGCEQDAIVPISNRGKSPEALAAEVLAVLDGESALVFTDLQSGSCGFVARRLAHELPHLVVISGVNLPVLIDFAMNRRMPMEDLVPRLLGKGRTAIGCSAPGLEEHERRPLSR